MRHIIKIITASLLLSLSLSFMSLGMNKGLCPLGIGNHNQEVWSYYTGEYDENEHCVYLQSQWKEINGNWFYFDEKGISKYDTWFHDASGKWYYFNNQSVMLHDTTTPDGYTVGSDGAWIQDGQVVVETTAAQ